ncbi:BRCA1-associated RING domain protein 1-like, partial [Saccostrea cucullata]|uniref:BRCA1-associated RING domain protein 1-like n=1 Tax=Saccostrea cuccullata TaxID=36930 RepID=UPI002ED0BFAC
MLDFTNTRQTLKDLENDLRCSVCGSIAGSPCTLGGCEHIYCSLCCEKLLGQCCVVCQIPVHVKDAQVNRQLFNLVNLCKRLGHILNNPESHDSENVIDPEAESNKSTPDGTSDVYDFVSPELSTPTKLSHKPESVKNGKQKRRSRSSKVTEKASPSPENVLSNNTAMVNQESTRSSGSRGKAERSAGVRKTRSTGPEEQTTMTQFFDYMETNDDILMNNGSSAAANFSSADEMEEKNPGETSKKIKVTGEPRCRTGKGSKILRVRKSPHNGNEDKEDYSAQRRDEGNVSKDNISSTVQNSGYRSGQCFDGEVQMERSITGQSSGGKRARRRSVGASGTTSSVDSLVPESPVPSDNKKSRRSVGASSSSGNRKKNRRSLPTCLNAEDVSVVISKPEKVKRTNSGQPKDQDHLNSSFSGKGSVIDKKNAKGETPLQVACIKGDLEKVQSLLSSGANPNNRDNAGWTPLHEACHYGYVKIAEMLIEAGALIDVPGTENETPLHDAVRHLKVDCIKLLVQHGASVNTRNIKGLTPIQLAGSNAELISALKTKAQNKSTHTAVQVDPLSFQCPCFVSTGLSRDQKITLQKCATKLQAKVTEDFSQEVTHIVTSCNKSGLCPRTMKYLQGVLTGRWIVNMDWVEMCLEYGMKVCEEAFEIPGTSSDPESCSAQKGRVNRQQQLPGLFDGCQF